MLAHPAGDSFLLLSSDVCDKSSFSDSLSLSGIKKNVICKAKSEYDKRGRTEVACTIKATVISLKDINSLVVLLDVL